MTELRNSGERGGAAGASERASACPPPGHAPCPPRNAPAGPRERNACARAPGTQDGSALGGAELRLGGALRLRRCWQKSRSEVGPAD